VFFMAKGRGDTQKCTDQSRLIPHADLVVHPLELRAEQASSIPAFAEITSRRGTPN